MEELIMLEECPICRGAGMIMHEGGWSVQVECADCSAHTVYVEYNNDAEKAAAWEFIQFTASAETQATWSMATGYLPINLGTKDVAAFAEHLANTPALQVALAQFESSNPNVQEPVMMMQGSVDAVIKEASINVAEGTMTPEEAADYVVTECNKLFDEYNRANG